MSRGGGWGEVSFLVLIFLSAAVVSCLTSKGHSLSSSPFYFFHTFTFILTLACTFTLTPKCIPSLSLLTAYLHSHSNSHPHLHSTSFRTHTRTLPHPSLPRLNPALSYPPRLLTVLPTVIHSLNSFFTLSHSSISSIRRLFLSSLSSLSSRSTFPLSLSTHSFLSQGGHSVFYNLTYQHPT
ncbi:hypothetical protein BKA57DRAFT_182590 [Linnemannia elongata]|nr:hypothetical protein BKA57DRAFT_182590 [Linnemannia elongata]